jgi:signal transduction histidine kinase
MNLQIAYLDVLKSYLKNPQEVDLLHAYELGKQFQNQHISPDEIIGMHLEAIEQVSEDLSQEERMQEVKRSFNVLLEMMIAYGIAYADAYRLLEQAAREAEEAKFELEQTIVELDLANQQLQDLDRVKTRFFSNMSHELRTPLNAIIGFAEDAVDGLAGELTPRQSRYVTNILNAGRHLLSVINDILDLAKLQSGKITLEVIPMSLQDVFAEIAETLQPLVARKHQTLEVHDASGLPRVMADHAKLYQILLNLTSNAHKFTPDGGTIRLAAGVDGDVMRVAVVDNGIGIPPEALTHLFEEFRQVEQYRKPQTPGTGLGLSITRRMVEMHGGTITVESRVDAGSTFTFTLPLAEEAP